MTLPEVVSCRCTPGVASPIPEMIISPRSRCRIPGQLDLGLRGYYPLGPFGGEDISGRGNHAIPAIDPVALTDGILCEQAEVMDGRQYFTLPFELDDLLTVSLFIRPAKPKLEQTILSIGDDVRFGLSWMLEPIIWLGELAADEANITADPLVADQWYHIAFVRDGNEFRIYVDGLTVPLMYNGLTSSPVFANTVTPAGVATISRYREASGLHGAYQDVVIRASALEAAEIAAEYRSYCTTLFTVEAA